VKIVQSRNLEWDEDIDRIAETRYSRYSCRITVRKSMKNGHLEDKKKSCINDIKIYLTKIGCDEM